MTALAFDNSPLSHFARAGKLEAIERLARDYDCYVTQAVLDELANGASEHPELSEVPTLDWLAVVRVDGLEELQAFAEYARRLGSGARDIGEASTLAWAEINGALAIIDERAGRRHGNERGVETHGSLWLIARGVLVGALDEAEADALVQSLVDTEAWFPAFPHGFCSWAREQGLM